MAMFLSETNPRSAGAGAGRAQGIVTQTASIGPPRAPPTNFAALPGGISVLPNVPALPAASGIDSQRVPLNPYGRIPSRANVTLEKNPRIALAYTIISSENQKTQGDLTCITKSDGWDAPELFTVRQLFDSANEEINTGNDLHEFFCKNSFVGVFNNAMDSNGEKYGTETVTINSARFCTIRDYWGFDIRAGESLFFMASYVEPPTGAAPAAKRSNANKVRFYFAKGKSHKDVYDRIKKKEFGGDDKLSTVVRIGMAQNFVIPVRRGADYNELSEMEWERYNSDGEYTTRTREIHLDHLMVPIAYGL